MKPLKLENTVVNVKSQEQWDIVTEYYGIKWESSGDYYRDYAGGTWMRPFSCRIHSYGAGCGTTKDTYSDYASITFAKWQKLIKEHEKESKMGINSFEDFKRVAKEWSGIIEDRCAYIAIDEDGLHQYSSKPNLLRAGMFNATFHLKTISKDIKVLHGATFCISLAELRNEPPKLEDLESGGEITLRVYGKYYNVKELKKVFGKNGGMIRLNEFDINMCNFDEAEYDIMKITSPQGELIWERKPEAKEVDVDVSVLISEYEEKHNVKVNTSKLK